jgi:hypothetical protein
MGWEGVSQVIVTELVSQGHAYFARIPCYQGSNVSLTALTFKPNEPAAKNPCF